MTKKQKTYHIMFNINLDTDVEISAASLEEALQKGKQIKLTEVVSFDGNYNDGEIKVTGVFGG